MSKAESSGAVPASAPASVPASVEASPVIEEPPKKLRRLYESDDDDIEIL